MRRAQLKVLDPCPQRFEDMEGRGTSRHCERCTKQVHDLSAMTEAEAAVFLADRAGQELCVRYGIDGGGEPKFRAPPPPRRLAAVGALALAACTGYARGDELDSPEDAMACQDAAGYTIPCDDAGGDPETDPDPDPNPDPPLPPQAPKRAQADAIDTASDATPSPDPANQAQGCPIPPPGADQIVGIIISPRLERRYRRQLRREKRQRRRG